MRRLSNFGLIAALLKSKLGMPLKEHERIIADIYASDISNFMSSGRLLPVSELSSDELQLAFNFIGTKHTKHKIYAVTFLAPEFSGNITMDVKNLVAEISPRTKIALQYVSVPHKVNAKLFKRKYANAVNQANRLEKLFNSYTPEQQILGKREGSVVISQGTVNNKKHVAKSFEYIEDELKTGSIAPTFIFIHAYTHIDEDMKPDEDPFSYEKAMQTYFEASGSRITEVHSIKAFMESYAPTARVPSKLAVGEANALLLSHSNYIAHLDDSQGIEGESGPIVGILSNNATPLAIDPKESPSAQITAIIGKTGKGKSDEAKTLIEEYMLEGDYIDIVDYKGTDYTHLKVLYPDRTTIVNFLEGVYVNTLDISAIPYATISTRTEAIEFTKNVFITLMELTPAQHDTHYNDLSTMFTQALDLYYQSKGVLRLPHTFHNSSRCSYADAWDHIKLLLRTSPTMRESYSAIGSRAVKSLDQYFAQEGALQSYFTTPVSMTDLMSTKCVIYALNRLVREGAALQLQISYMYCFHISTMRNYTVKQQKAYQVLFYEEIQEAKKDVVFLHALAKKCTLARSSNAILYLLLNNGEIFTDSDSTAIRESMASIKNSITSYFIGYVEPGDYEVLKKVFRIEQLYPILDKIISPATKSSYQYHFAFLYDTGKHSGYGMFKQDLPAKYRDNPLYTTRDVRVVQDAKVSSN